MSANVSSHNCPHVLWATGPNLGSCSPWLKQSWKMTDDQIVGVHVEQVWTQCHRVITSGQSTFLSICHVTKCFFGTSLPLGEEEMLQAKDIQ